MKFRPLGTEQNRTEQNFIHVDKHVRSLTGDIRYI